MGSGGPRSGAGRPGYRAKAEQLCRVNVTDWHKQGRLQSDCAFTWRWLANGEQVADMTVQVSAGALVKFIYRFNDDTDPLGRSTLIKLVKAPCHFGGWRFWFDCPECSKPVGVVYLRYRRFACRTCQKVAYSSQSEDAHDRTWRKAQRLEARLGPYWKRPKGMRHKTFSRLTGRLIGFEMMRDELLERLAGPYLRQLGLTE